MLRVYSENKEGNVTAKNTRSLTVLEEHDVLGRSLDDARPSIVTRAMPMVNKTAQNSVQNPSPNYQRTDLPLLINSIRPISRPKDVQTKSPSKASLFATYGASNHQRFDQRTHLYKSRSSEESINIPTGGALDLVSKISDFEVKMQGNMQQMRSPENNIFI